MALSTTAMHMRSPEPLLTTTCSGAGLGGPVGNGIHCRFAIASSHMAWICGITPLLLL